MKAIATATLEKVSSPPSGVFSVTGDGRVAAVSGGAELGGFFIRKPIPIAVGTELDVTLELPTGTRIQAKGKVVHAVVSPDRCGNGVELDRLSHNDATALQQFLGSGDAWFN